MGDSEVTELMGVGSGKTVVKTEIEVSMSSGRETTFPGAAAERVGARARAVVESMLPTVMCIGRSDVSASRCVDQAACVSGSDSLLGTFELDLARDADTQHRYSPLDVRRFRVRSTLRPDGLDEIEI